MSLCNKSFFYENVNLYAFLYESLLSYDDYDGIKSFYYSYKHLIIIIK